VVFLADTTYVRVVTISGMLRTGEAARRLGVSRQHVVDLCNRGRLPYVIVGTHRRIPEQALTALAATANLPGTDWQQSQWLHAALVPRLVLDPVAVIGKARENLARFRKTGAIDVHSEPYAREWETILDAGVAAIITTFLDSSSPAATLRSCSPFVGVLPEAEVQAIRRAYRQHRRDTRAGWRPAQ
jgi:excisionase family DNA binding protein